MVAFGYKKRAVRVKKMRVFGVDKNFHKPAYAVSRGNFSNEDAFIFILHCVS